MTAKKKPDPALLPALAEERKKMLEERKRKLLTSRATFLVPARVEFSGISPMHRPNLDPKRDLPQPTIRPGALDAASLPSRGF